MADVDNTRTPTPTLTELAAFAELVTSVNFAEDLNGAVIHFNPKCPPTLTALFDLALERRIGRLHKPRKG